MQTLTEFDKLSLSLKIAVDNHRARSLKHLENISANTRNFICNAIHTCIKENRLRGKGDIEITIVLPVEMTVTQVIVRWLSLKDWLITTNGPQCITVTWSPGTEGKESPLYRKDLEVALSSFLDYGFKTVVGPIIDEINNSSRLIFDIKLRNPLPEWCEEILGRYVDFTIEADGTDYALVIKNELS